MPVPRIMPPLPVSRPSLRISIPSLPISRPPLSKLEPGGVQMMISLRCIWLRDRRYWFRDRRCQSSSPAVSKWYFLYVALGFETVATDFETATVEARARRCPNDDFVTLHLVRDRRYWFRDRRCGSSRPALSKWSLFGPPVRNYTFTKLWAYFRNAKTQPYAVQRFLDWILFQGAFE